MSLIRLAPCCAAPMVLGAENLKTESRTPYHHVIPLRDAAGDMITLPAEFDEQGHPQEARGRPMSTAQTCGRCHEYSVIAQGWHFNAGTGIMKPGRPGEPWMLVDPPTRTQIPISYRGWEGTFKPSTIGLSDYDFLLAFARQFPGGGVGAPAIDQVNTNDVRLRRMLITGTLEIDCLLCHTKHGDYDHDARFKSLNYENFKWTPTVGSELGIYGASRPAKAFADSWRPPRSVPTNLPPIKYDRSRFNSANEVTFEVTRRPPVENCYYCHTANVKLGDARWHSDGDVHIRAGMRCTDCHRNGIDHMIVRGYEGEIADRVITDAMVDLRVKLLLRDNGDLPGAEARNLAKSQLQSELGQIQTLTCRGCHYGTEEGGGQSLPGRLGAPRPAHRGLPTVHLEKLTCTACHSGPVPQDTQAIVHTAMAHKLGLPGPERGENTAPVIVEPVFLRNPAGKIGPNRVVWPSYWGVLNAGAVTPMLPEKVAQKAGEKLPAQTAEQAERDPYNTRPLTEIQIRDVLAALSPGVTNGEAVFIAAGRIFRLTNDSLRSEPSDLAKPYAWALSHDVRPANQSLGVKSCAECHGEKSPIYFAHVASRGPVPPPHRTSIPQWQLRGDNALVAATFAYTFLFRPTLKVLTLACAFVLFLVLLNHALFGVRGGSRGGGRQGS